MSADILIYALVAAGLVFWLRSILGTRHSDDLPPKANPFVQPAETGKKFARENAPLHASPVLNPELEAADLRTGFERNMSIADENTYSGMADIAHADPEFSPLKFLRGAQDAFALIVESFAEGDRETLRGLLGEQVYASFARVLDERAQKGEKASVEIHAIRKCEVVAARMERRMAVITVRFVADETSILRDRGDKLLVGHPDRVTETIDIWTFQRDVRSRDPRWLVVETREGDGDDQGDSTVPAAS